ncbi:unnamed protein product [Linum trigynum]|uniref:Uncharacterized protein n=1 Tax=Linum trigynum TaxID=586398 RepID=A0AAV2GBE2_9ROSI
MFTGCRWRWRRQTARTSMTIEEVGSEGVNGDGVGIGRVRSGDSLFSPVATWSCQANDDGGGERRRQRELVI